MGASRVDGFPGLSFAPRTAEHIRQFSGPNAIDVIRSHIVGIRKLRIFVLRLADGQIGVEGFQYVLVRSDGVRVPHLDCLFLHGRANAVGDDTICGEVSAADDVSRTSGGYSDSFVRKEAFPVAVRYKFRTALAVGIGVLSVQTIRFPIAPWPFVVLVDFVRGDVQEGFDALTISHAFQQIDGSHDVRAVSCHRILVAFPDDGLRCQVDDDFRLAGVEGFLKQSEIADVSDDGMHTFFYLCK